MIKILIAVLALGISFNVMSDEKSKKSKPSLSKKNMLEQALDLNSGTPALWAKFKDEGGLNKVSQYYGLPITELMLTHDNEKVKTIVLSTPAGIAPKTVRTALIAACGLKEDLWEFDNLGGDFGSAENSAISCAYKKPSGAGSYELSVLKN